MKLWHRLNKIFPNFVPKSTVLIIITTVVGTGAVLISKISTVPAILVLIASLCAIFSILQNNTREALLNKGKNVSQKQMEVLDLNKWKIDALQLSFYWAMVGFLVAVIVPPARFYPIIMLLFSFSVASGIYGIVNRCRNGMRKRRDKTEKN